MELITAVKVEDAEDLSKYRKGGGRRIRYDILRIACALSVLLFHFESTSVVLPQVAHSGLFLNFFGTRQNLGSIAVEIFWILSGILQVKTLQSDFDVRSYYRHRFSRLYIPFWFSWGLVCIWRALTESTFYFAGSFNNAIFFLLTFLGVDGWVNITVGVPHTFYLVGEWFFGAMIIITALWPLVRKFYLKNRRGTLAALFLIGYLSWLIPESAPISVLRLIPFSRLAMFVLGIYLAECSETIQGNFWCGVLGLGVTVAGFLAPNIMQVQDGSHILTIARQFIALGVVLAVDGVRINWQNGKILQIRQAISTPLIWLSSLTMYFFMFQHVVESKIVSSAVVSAQNGFGSFDYWGLGVLSIFLTLLCSIFASEFESLVKRRLKGGR